MSGEASNTSDNGRKRKRNSPADSPEVKQETSQGFRSTERTKKFIQELKRRIREDVGNSDNTYVYPPLKEDHGQDIRVLVIEPGKGDDPIKCRLFPSRLGGSALEESALEESASEGSASEDPKRSDTPVVPYTALSYYWGDGEPIHEITVTSYDTPTQPMEKPTTVEEVIFRMRKHSEWRKTGTIFVRRNLYTALQRFRSKEEPVIMWIDALCIDQKDKYERSAQVRKMHELYIQAEKVTIWLGDGFDTEFLGTNPRILQASPRQCFKFLKQILDLQNLDDLLRNIENDSESDTLQNAKQVVHLMCNKWFTRRWVIQELAHARKAEIVYGKETMSWPDFADAIAIFIKSQDSLPPGSAKLYVETAVSGSELSAVDIVKKLGASEMVDFIDNLFRRSENGDIQQRMMNLETLVSNLLAFEATNPRDTIYAVLSLGQDTFTLPNIDHRLLPAYQNSLLDVYTDFIDYCIETSQSLDILLRHWAPPERSFSELLTRQLPTWIPSIDRSSHGTASQRIRGRSNGDGFVATSIRGSQKTYSATLVLRPEKRFPFVADAAPKLKYTGSLLVQGLQIGTIEEITPRAAKAMIFKETFELAGFNHQTWQDREQWAPGVERVPEGFWRTIVADRGPEGTNPPPWYSRACSESLRHLSMNGDLRPDDVIDLPKASSVAKLFMKRVKDVLWERRFVRINFSGETGKTYGLTPKESKEGDIICVLFGCSVPVVLRQHGKGTLNTFHMIGECFVYGIMDGEAVSGQSWEPPYNGASCFELV